VLREPWVPGDPQEHLIVIVAVSAFDTVSVISDLIVAVSIVNIVTATAGFAPR
jgi:hypothetical protein